MIAALWKWLVGWFRSDGGSCWNCGMRDYQSKTAWKCVYCEAPMFPAPKG